MMMMLNCSQSIPHGHSSVPSSTPRLSASNFAHSLHFSSSSSSLSELRLSSNSFHASIKLKAKPKHKVSAYHSYTTFLLIFTYLKVPMWLNYINKLKKSIFTCSKKWKFNSIMYWCKFACLTMARAKLVWDLPRKLLFLIWLGRFAPLFPALVSIVILS